MLGMRERKTPQEKKRASLERDHPLQAKNPHAFRKGWPAKERSAQKAFRHGIKQALRRAQGPADRLVEERVDVADVRRRSLRKWTPAPLGRVIEQKQARRVTTYRRKKNVQRRPIQYNLPGGWILLVGATDAANARLITEIARPQDWWFHAQGVLGSHTILRARRGSAPGRETLHQAAAVAASHSRARTAELARVYCTRAAYVTQLPGAKPGTVEASRCRVLTVHPDRSAVVAMSRYGEGGPC
jgi:predicted ribosome quality control (RQC) complex YloA/Tae2 family protein